MLSHNEIVDDLLQNQLTKDQIITIRKLEESQLPTETHWFHILVVNNYSWLRPSEIFNILFKIWKMVNKLERYKSYR